MIVAVNEQNQEIFDRLYQNYQSESAPITGVKPDENGLYTLDYKNFGDVKCYLIYKEEGKPGGIAVIGTEAPFEIFDSYVSPAYRRQTLGIEAVKEMLDLHKGEWVVKQPLESEKAVAFWSKTVKMITKDQFKEASLYDKRWGRANILTFTIR